jgi:hypothetical protein
LKGEEYYEIIARWNKGENMPNNSSVPEIEKNATRWDKFIA